MKPEAAQEVAEVVEAEVVMVLEEDIWMEDSRRPTATIRMLEDQEEDGDHLYPPQDQLQQVVPQKFSTHRSIVMLHILYKLL